MPESARYGGTCLACATLRGCPITSTDMLQKGAVCSQYTVRSGFPVLGDLLDTSPEAVNPRWRCEWPAWVSAK